MVQGRVGWSGRMEWSGAEPVARKVKFMQGRSGKLGVKQEVAGLAWPSPHLFLPTPFHAALESQGDGEGRGAAPHG